jgi:IS30 family transposase
MASTPLRQLVDRALEDNNTTLTTFINTGLDEGKSIRTLATDLTTTTGIEVSWRTLYRWVR